MKDRSARKREVQLFLNATPPAAANHTQTALELLWQQRRQPAEELFKINGTASLTVLIFLSSSAANKNRPPEEFSTEELSK